MKLILVTLILFFTTAFRPLMDNTQLLNDLGTVVAYAVIGIVSYLAAKSGGSKKMADIITNKLQEHGDALRKESDQKVEAAKQETKKDTDEKIEVAKEQIKSEALFITDLARQRVDQLATDYSDMSVQVTEWRGRQEASERENRNLKEQLDRADRSADERKRNYQETLNRLQVKQETQDGEIITLNRKITDTVSERDNLASSLAQEREKNQSLLKHLDEALTEARGYKIALDALQKGAASGEVSSDR
jgi:chromosome segregation ATPase